MKRAFQKVSEQTQAPDYLLKRFAAANEAINEDPYEGLRQREAENRQRIAHDEMIYGRPEAPKAANDWEVSRSADTYRPRQMNRAAQAQTADPEDLSSRSVRRIDTGEKNTTNYRPMEHLGSDRDVYVTRMDAEGMLNSGQSFFDPNLANITAEIAERDMRKYAQQAMRDKQSMVGSKWEASNKGRVQRDHKRVLDRWANFDAVNTGFTRVANERESASRFGMVDPTEAMRRDMMRQEEVEARMQRKASIKGIGHDTPAQRERWEDDVQTMAPTLQREHNMSWMSDFFKGK